MQKNYSTWDLFIRIFHWSLLAAVAFCWWSARQSDWLEWHMRSGYLIVGLLSARLIWGFVGPKHARFRRFIYRPSHTFAYLKALLKGQEQQYIGHNPLGGLAAIALLIFVAIQAGTGLFANDDIYLEGILAQWVSSATSSALTSFHKAWFDALLALIGVHVAAVLFHQFFRKESLLQAMVLGKKKVENPADE